MNKYKVEYKISDDAEWNIAKDRGSYVWLADTAQRCLIFAKSKKTEELRLANNLEFIEEADKIVRNWEWRTSLIEELEGDI